MYVIMPGMWPTPIMSSPYVKKIGNVDLNVEEYI